MKEFAKREDCVSHLASALELGRDSPWQGELIDAFADACRVDAREERPSFDFRLARWVIRDEDLNLFGAVKDGMTALASVQYVFADLTASGITSVGLAVCMLLRNAYRKGATVSSTQAALLAILKDRGPSSASEIASAGSSAGNAWTEQQVRAELTALTKVATKNDTVAFVAEDANGKWSLRGV